MISALADCTESDLVALARSSHDAAFAEIVRRHREALYRIAMASLGQTEDALDAVQESFIAAYLALARFDVSRPLRPWLARIVLNQCRDRLRRRAVRRFLLPFVGTDVDVADAAPGPAHLAADRDALARTMRAIAALPAGLREPLVLTAIEGMAQADVAQTLGLSAKAVELRVRRARARLRDALDF